MVKLIWGLLYLLSILVIGGFVAFTLALWLLLMFA